MNILVTAGNTITPIDQVRCITNIFTGRTGTGIALSASDRQHSVTLLTSHPELVEEMYHAKPPNASRWQVRGYRTFDQFQSLMHSALTDERYDAVIHCAAVSDYKMSGVYAPAPGTVFDAHSATWSGSNGEPARMSNRSAGKIKSSEPELWLRLGRTPKLVDCVRADWGFTGVLVKFKLEVGLLENELREVAEHSRAQSSADIMVANTLEGSREWALLGPIEGIYHRVTRTELPGRLLDRIEELHRGSSHG